MGGLGIATAERIDLFGSLDDDRRRVESFQVSVEFQRLSSSVQ
jgi:hypothetical protein